MNARYVCMYVCMYVCYVCYVYACEEDRYKSGDSSNVRAISVNT